MHLFSQGSLDFLYFNHKYNTKTWFHEHKEDYKKYLVEPFEDLVYALQPTLLRIDSELHVDPKSGGTISRLHKDLRFAKDKSCLYRDTMWCTLTRDKANYTLPCFFFELSPYRMRYGLGIYRDGASTKKSREMIISQSPSFLEAKRCYESQDVFNFIEDNLKRGPVPDAPEDIKVWLDKKYLGFTVESRDINLLCSSELATTIAQHFEMIKPIYDFMMTFESLTVRK